MYIYIKSESGFYTVGHYAPNSYSNGIGEIGIYHTFISESDHISPRDAAARVNYLNGGNGNTIAT